MVVCDWALEEHFLLSVYVVRVLRGCKKVGALFCDFPLKCVTHGILEIRKQDTKSRTEHEKPPRGI